MAYGDFGLDAVKKSRDKGETEKWWYDPWLQERITSGRHFYLCFSNWIASRRTIQAFMNQEPVEAIDGDQCQKCRAKAPKVHYHIDGLNFEDRGMEIAICPDCVAWAAEYLDKEPPVAPGTQFSLF